MKKIILILTFIFILPAWASCPLSSNENICTLSKQDSGMMLFQNQNIQGLNMNDNSMPSNSLKSTSTGDSFNRVLNQNGIKMHGSLGCGFGNCNRENNNDFLFNQ